MSNRYVLAGPAMLYELPDSPGPRYLSPREFAVVRERERLLPVLDCFAIYDREEDAVAALVESTGSQ